MRRYNNVVIEPLTAAVPGRPVSGATVTVKKAAIPAGTGANASLFSDEGVTPLANPVSTDDYGHYGYYVADGFYDLVIVKAGVVSKTVADVAIVDPGQLIASLVVNVKDGGAKGDGVTDDRAAIQSLIDAAAPGTRIFFPPGTYMLSRDLRLKSDIELCGVQYQSVLKRMNNSSPDPGQTTHGRMLNADSSLMPYGRIYIHDLVLNCNAANNTITVSPLEAYSVEDFVIKRVRVLDSDATIYIPNPQRLKITECYLEVLNLHIESRVLEPFTNPVDVLIHGNTLTTCKVFGIGCNGAKRLRVSDNVIFSIAPTPAVSAAIDVNLSEDVTVAGNVIRGNTNGDGIYTSGARRCAIVGNTIYDVSAFGIHVANELDLATNVAETTIIGNVVRKAGGGIQCDSVPEGTVIAGNYLRELNSKGILFERFGASTKNNDSVVCCGNVIIDYAKTEAFQGAITGNWIDNSLFFGNIFDGKNNANVRGVIFGASSTNNRVTGNTFRNLIAEKVLDNGTGNEVFGNRGYVTEKNVLSGTFLIDAAGLRTVTIAHGLDYTPAKEHCQLTVVEESNVDDWAYNLLKIDTVDATNVTAKINVSTASATGAATARLALRAQRF